jgi:hypothetical protein
MKQTLVASVIMCFACAHDLSAQGLQAARHDTPVVWSQGEPFSLRLLASRSAPVLWFSAREPLTGLGYLLPSDMPTTRNVIPPSNKCDQAGENAAQLQRRVLFFRVDSISLLEDLPTPKTRNIELPLDAVLKERRQSKEDQDWSVDDFRYITLRYMMYYPRDCGFGDAALFGHPHDLENVLIRIEIVEDREERLSARIADVNAFAHGVDHYSNELAIGQLSDVVFPIRVLVEERKHAVAPDRNADGRFDPKYDVNVDARDAWGVTGFEAQTKTAYDVAQQVWPPGFDASLQYELLDSASSSFCALLKSTSVQEVERSVDEGKELVMFASKHGFCEGAIAITPSTFDSRLDPLFVLNLRDDASRGRFGNALRSLSFRYESGKLAGPNVAWAAMVREYERFWFVVRLNVPLNDLYRRGSSEEFLFQRSAAAPVEPYGLFGTWQGKVDKPVAGTTLTIPDVGGKFVTEGGLKIRFRTEHTPFLGFKIGIRALNFERPGVVFEVGPAPF